jgi:hypothetical protein
MLFALIALVAVMPAFAQDSVPLGEVIEAESLVAVGAEPEDTYAEDALGGAYVYLPEKQMENAKPKSYLEVPLEDMQGMYAVRVRALALNSGTDSLRWGTGPPWRSMGLGRATDGWEWFELETYGWREGVTTLLVGAREASRIDAIEVTKMAGASLARHQRTPLRPEPNGSRPIGINPPTFRWADQGGVACRVQVARDDAFAEVVLDETAEESFLRPVEPLPEGRLWWRWRRDDWDEGQWSQAESFVIGTEIGMLHPLAKACPGKTFHPATPIADCPDMKLATLEKMVWALEEMREIVAVEEPVRSKAEAAIRRMLEL